MLLFLFCSGYESNLGVSQRGRGVGGREQGFDGNEDSAFVTSVRREGFDRVEAERVQRVQGSAVRNEERELVAADDSVIRFGVLLSGILGFRGRRVRGVLVSGIGVHDIHGEAAAEGGGGDREYERGGAGDAAVRVQEVEGGDGGAEGGVGEEWVGGGGVGGRGWDKGEGGESERVFWGAEIWG